MTEKIKPARKRLGTFPNLHCFQTILVEIISWVQIVEVSRAYDNDVELTRSEVWSLIKECTASEAAGKQVTTSLLGDVEGLNVGGKVFSLIPIDLEAEALHHGFRIIGASVMDGTYTLEKR